MYKPKLVGNCYNYKPSNEEIYFTNESKSNCNACVYFVPRNCVHKCSFENDADVV